MARVAGLIVDSFAGGGGASLGIELALGRSPDVAINHDRAAIAMHMANHPGSRHYAEDVWKVDPVEATRGQPVDLMWLSPDCTHFSKAKGAKPVSKKIRSLAWVAHRWAMAVRPRIIVLENVEEFEHWGPVLRTTLRPCPDRKGATFRRFVARLRRLGYAVEWRQLRACDYGAPTIRKRLFLIARCDGEPIVWPRPTHGPGRPLPWRTAAECIDWSLACPSIFLTREEARTLGVKRPLAENTLRRIARGIRRFVIENPRPFIVPMQHQNRPTGLDEPVQTVTTQGNKFNLVTPFVVPTAHAGDARAHSIEEPVRTITGGVRGDHALVAPALINTRNGERSGQGPRCRDIERPYSTVTAQGSQGALVSAFLAKHYGGHESPGAHLDLPISTLTTKDHHHVVAAHIRRDFGNSVGGAADSPMPTITGDGGGHAGVVASHLLKLKGSSVMGQELDTPAPTVLAQGTHLAEVRAFLLKYNGTEQRPDLFAPMPTVMSKDRFGLVTVEGDDYVIADIGMRMLVPRELFRAQGFPDSYRIDAVFTKEVRNKRTGAIRLITRSLTKTDQVRMCGNSVPPDMAAAIVRANAPAGVEVEAPAEELVA